MQTNPLVSVVMPAFNVETYIVEAIDSILAQTYRHWEIIVVNDGSTDSTAALAERYASRDARIRVHHQNNGGIAKARNVGWRLARGGYIAWMDADDVALPRRLELQVEFLKRNSDVGVLGGAYEEIDSKGRKTGRGFWPVRDDYQIKEALSRYCSLADPTIMLRQELLENIGGYRDAFPVALDYDLWLRLADITNFANLREVVVFYR
jgi:glycosyltransferase involved in cell wall biosynthesis